MWRDRHHGRRGGQGQHGMTTSSGGGASRSGRRRRTGENRGDLIFAVIEGTKLQNVSQHEGRQGSVGHGVQSVHFAYHLCLACLKAADLENRNVMSSHRLPRRSRPRPVTLYVVVVDRLLLGSLRLSTRVLIDCRRPRRCQVG